MPSQCHSTPRKPTTAAAGFSVTTRDSGEAGGEYPLTPLKILQLVKTCGVNPPKERSGSCTNVQAEIGLWELMQAPIPIARYLVLRLQACSEAAIVSD